MSWSSSGGGRGSGWPFGGRRVGDTDSPKPAEEPVASPKQPPVKDHGAGKEPEK